MRTLIVALTITSLAAPALGQEMSRGSKHRGAAPKAEQPKNKVDDKAYKAALDRVPTPAKKYDPWQTVRPDDGKH
jgi:hypothetical protein